MPEPLADVKHRCIGWQDDQLPGVGNGIQGCAQRGSNVRSSPTRSRGGPAPGGGPQLVVLGLAGIVHDR